MDAHAPTKPSGLAKSKNPLPDETINANIESALERGYPTLGGVTPHDGVLAIVGGGPSLNDTFRLLRRTKAGIMALNGAHDFLLSKGIKPDACTLFDPRPDVARYVERWRKGVDYLVASQCDPAVFDALEGASVIVWHGNVKTGAEDILRAHEKEHPDYGWVLLPGGSTVATRAIWIGMTMGYSRFELYGLDSCYSGMEHHAYSQPLRATMLESIGDLKVGDETFRCAMWMANQVHEFEETLKRHPNLTFSVFGGGPLEKLVEIYR